MRKYCHFCGKEIQGLPFRCKYCGELFCGYHHLPENHNCPDLPKVEQLDKSLIENEFVRRYDVSPQIEVKSKRGYLALFAKIFIFVMVGTLILSIYQNCMIYNEMIHINKEIEALTQRQTNLQAVLEKTTNEKEFFSVELNYTKDRLNVYRFQLNKTLTKIALLQSRDKYILHDPTYWEVIEFIHSDKTDRHEYIDNKYVCTHFARDVNNNAERRGIRCAFVTVNLRGGGHAIVAFNTTDRGIIFFEPQSDEELRYLKEGKDYWADCIITKGNYYYKRDSDNIVESYILIW